MNKLSFSQLAYITMGQSPNGEYCGINIEGVPLLNGPAEFTEFAPVPVQYTSDPKKMSKVGDILFCVRGSTTGRMNWSNQEYAIGRGLAAITHKEGKQYNHFLKYLIENYLSSLLNNTNGSTFPNLTSSLLADFIVDVPDLPIQKEISNILANIDKKIELNNQINAELEAMAKTLYDYWFVQFDFPDANGKPYKSSGGKMAYNETLKREIPDGWEAKVLADIATTGSGGTPLSSKKEYYANGDIPWINSGELNTPFIVSTNNFITKLGLEKSSAKLFKKNTILMAMYGATAGKVSFIDFPSTTNQAICGINPIDQHMNVYLKFNLERLYQYLVNLSSGSARDNLSQDKIRNLDIVVPSHYILSKFDGIVQGKMQLILNNIKQNQELEKLRDWLLPMLMNGQVTVKQ
ncbi:restriction endonuclease subunit S [Psychrobacter piscatorii]|uniref:restriction endonuclease subunit S n=1 Tax=Psychrobacter piscatorii TaxID=554343 RepID=UPI001917D9DF|nr:restriction endonuclease subunit S [Psychrobacter piscatorii]